ncbi:MAG: hypothetical protein ACRDFS_04945 [Chloroflexota bacterium]
MRAGEVDRGEVPGLEAGEERTKVALAFVILPDAVCAGSLAVRAVVLTTEEAVDVAVPAVLLAA